MIEPCGARARMSDWYERQCERVFFLKNRYQNPAVWSGKTKPEIYYMQRKADLIKDVREIIMQSWRICPNSWDVLYMPAIHTFASYAHLIPASANDHHMHQGGLLKHSLETAYYSLNISDTFLWGQEIAIERRKKSENAHRFAVWLYALIHDVGKILTDIHLFDIYNEKIVWDPLKHDLYTWAKLHGVKQYTIQWKKNRLQKHENVMQMMYPIFLNNTVKDFLREVSNDPYQDLVQAFTGHQKDGRIITISNKADAYSVRDAFLKMAATRYSPTDETGKFIKELLEHNIQSVWKPNTPGSPLWRLTDGSVYLIWTQVAETLVADLQQAGITGISYDHDKLASQLARYDIIATHENENPYFTISPDIMRESKPDLKLRAVRLVHTSNKDIPVVSGTLFYKNQKIETEICNEEDTQQENGSKDDSLNENNDQPKEKRSASGAVLTPATKKAVAANDQKSKVPPFKPKSAVTTKNKPPTSMPPLTHIVVDDDHSNPPVKKYLSPPDESNDQVVPSEHQEVKESGALEKTKSMMRLGPHGDMLLTFIEDILSGEKKWDTDVKVMKNGMAIPYPHGFEGYGYEAQEIRKRLEKHNVIIPEPITGKSLWDISFGLGSFKSLVIGDQLGEDLISLAKGKNQIENNKKCTARSAVANTAKLPAKLIAILKKLSSVKEFNAGKNTGKMGVKLTAVIVAIKEFTQDESYQAKLEALATGQSITYYSSQWLILPTSQKTQKKEMVNNHVKNS